MLIRENSEIISEVVNNLFSFVQKDENIKKDFVNYLDSQKIDKSSVTQVEAALIPYALNRRIGKKQESIIDSYLKTTKKLTKKEKAVLEGLSQTIFSIFEIKKILEQGFELYNLVNELNLTAISLTKSSKFKGVGAGQFMIAGIFPYENEYYLLEIKEIMSAYNKEAALRFAITKQINEPELLYKDNKAKLKEIEQIVSTIGEKFKEFFQTDEIITSNTFVDSLISNFNDYIEEGKTFENDEIQSLIKPPETPEYFEVSEFTVQNKDLLQTVNNGFASHSKTYDIGIIYDFNLGLTIVPFYRTFKSIFQVDDYKAIKGYKDCILNYLNSSKIPPSILEKVSAENPEKFINIINEVTEKENSFESLIDEYKKDYLKVKKFSSTTVLYSSKALQSLMNLLEERRTSNFFDKEVGRNDPCPCGSGKKYKKCCLK